MPRSTLLRVARAVAVALAACALASPSASAFDLGFNNEDLNYDAGTVSWRQPAPASLDAGLTNASAAGAKTYRVMVQWDNLARGSSRPARAKDAADPAWPGYRWAGYDALVRSLTAHDLEPLMWIARAPDWAEGPKRPPVSDWVPAGTWKPSPTHTRYFAEALATRYSGSYPDPLQPGRTLPKVDTFMGWNEPNLFTEINPQWEKKRGRWQIASVGIYRQLQNAAYRGIKEAQPKATVLSAATGPFGGLSRKDPRIQPARFWRELLCVSSSRGKLAVRAKRCPKIRMDGWAHNPYPVGPPDRKARNADDVTVPDMQKLTAIMRAARRGKVVTAKAERDVWATEISWESKPDPRGLSLETHARYMAGAFYQLWKDGVDHVLWWNMRDDVSRNLDVTLQSGIFLRGDDPSQDVRKPAWDAFHFPFTAYRSRGVAELWTRPPGKGRVTVEVYRGGSWRKLTTLRRSKDGTAHKRLRLGKGTKLRARQGDETSLSWRAG